VSTRARAQVTDRDHGFRARVAALKEKFHARVGILADAPKKESDGETGAMSLVEVAVVHEFGAPAAHIPQRSFIRGTIDEKHDELRTLQGKLAERVFKGAITMRVAVEQLGLKAKGWMQQRIARNIPPPLAAATIERKGSSVALVNTGQLRSSIASIVQEGTR
jgi:hypothetical protein